MADPVCVISGVGPGTGTALVRRFAAEGYRIAMLARTVERLADLAAQVSSARAYVCDVSDQSQVDAALDLVEREMGAPTVLIHNAVGGAWGTFMEIDPAVLNRNFQVNTMGLLYLARRVAPSMVTAGKGAIIVTGNTSAQRGPRILRASRRRRRRNAFSPRRWRGIWAQRACTSPISSSMR
jgi:NAD(P)-dependent dehydrogenase (short-subunit alcohol dehydrogenase family)